MTKFSDVLGRRNLMKLFAGAGAGVAVLAAEGATAATGERRADAGEKSAMPAPAAPAIAGGQTITTRDGVSIFYKDWGPRDAQPIVFHHGWPLTADDWDTHMMFFLLKGYRVIAHDRRGHGRSGATSDGNDMDHYAADMDALATHLGLRNAVHIGHSTGGGVVARYVSRHGGNGRVAKAVLLSAVTPSLLRTPANPDGFPMEAYDGYRAGVAGGRPQLFTDIPSGPFFNYNRPGATVSQGIVSNWYRQGMMGDIKSQYDGIAAFSETDFTADLKAITVPVLVMHGEDDQVIPMELSSLRAIRLLQKGMLKTYPGLSHGMATTHPELIDRDLLAFIQG